MSKVYIFKRQMVYDSSYSNIIYFANELERSQFINSVLMNEGEDFVTELNKQPEVKLILKENIKNQIEVGANFLDVKNANYLAVSDVNSNVSFHFIQSVTNNGNNNKVTIEIEKDVFFNDLTMLDKFSNFKMTKGHADIKHYLDKEFGSLFLQPTRYQTIKRKYLNDAYSIFDDTPFIYVIQKVDDGKEAEDLLKTKGIFPFLESYKVYVAPIKSVPINKGSENINYIYIGNLQLNNRNIESLDILLSDTIIEDHNYQINYSIKWGNNEEHLYSYTLNGKYFPKDIGQTSYISLGGNAIVDYNDDAAYLNEQWYINGYVITTDESRNLTYVGIYDRDQIGQSNVIFKVRKISDLTYQFIIPTSNELVNIGKRSTSGTPLNYFYWEQNTGSQTFTHFYTNKDVAYGACEAIYDTCDNDNYPQQITIKNIIDMDSSNTWNSLELLRYISTTRDSTIITAKKSNFNPLILNDTINSTNISFEDIYNLVAEEVDNIGTIYRLTEINYDIAKEVNKYIINFPFEIKSELLLSGILPFRFILENEKEFNINNLFFENNNNLTITFNHYASVSPEWEERIKYEKTNLLDITTDDNSWKNEKEFAVGQSNWETYKTTSPVTSKLSLRILGHIGRIFGAGLLGSLFSDRTKIEDPKRRDQVKGSPFIYNNKALLKGGVVGIGGSVTTILNRSNIRNQPETSTGTGDLLGDLIYNYSNSFMLLFQVPYGNDYISLLKTLHRDGLEFDQEYYATNIKSIKRKYYNFIAVNNIFENIPLNTFNKSNEEIAYITLLFKDGIRIWWRYDNYLNYEVINEEDNI